MKCTGYSYLKGLMVFISLLLLTPFTNCQIVWQKAPSIKNYGFEVEDVTVSKKGELYLTGNIETTFRSTEPGSYNVLYKNRPAFLGDLSPLDRYMFVYKTNKHGDSLWLKLYPVAPAGTAITATTDGGFICAGFTTNPYTIDAANYRYVLDTSIAGKQYPPDYSQHSIIFKCNAEGEMEWYKVIPTEQPSNTSHIVAVSDGYWLTAHIEGTGIDQLERQNSRRIRLTKLNLQGEIVIDKALTAQYPYKGLWDAALVADTAEQLYLAGTARGERYLGHSAFLCYLDKAGNKIWERYTGETKKDLAVTSLNITEDKGFVLGAISDEEAHLYYLSSEASIIWQERFPRHFTWYMDGAKTAYNPQKGFVLSFQEQKSEGLQAIYVNKGRSFRQQIDLKTKGRLIDIISVGEAHLYIISPLRIIKVQSK